MRLWGTADGGSTWTLAGRLPELPSTISSGDLWVDYGPWMTADGHGIALTAIDNIPWPPLSGSTPPVREWTTDDGGRQWTAGPMVQSGGENSLLFNATFTWSPGGRTSAGRPAGRAGWPVTPCNQWEAG